MISFRSLPLLAVAVSPLCAAAQAVLPAGTPLPVAIPQKSKLRAGTPLRAELLYPVYVDSKLALPARTVVLGHVLSLSPDRKLRTAARFNGDFTPFHTPVVEFSSILLASGATLPIQTEPATDGAPIVRLLPGPPKRGGAIHQAFDAAKETVREAITFFTGDVGFYTAPGLGDRLLDLLWSQLPYHPQRIARGTSWTVVTTAALPLPADSVHGVQVNAAPDNKNAHMPVLLDRITAVKPAPPPETPKAGDPVVWTLESNLEQPLDSKTSHVGDPVTARVAVPILDPDGSVAVPQGSVLTGTVTQAVPARRFAHIGKLHFNFTQLQLPDQPAQSVRTSLSAADSRTPQQLAMDSEGNVEPTGPSKVVPILLAGLTAFAVKPDGGGSGAGEQAGKNALASSNSIGLIGTVLGLATHSPYVGGAVGAYGTALAAVRAYILRGPETKFPVNTRIVVRTQATRSAALKPSPQP